MDNIVLYYGKLCPHCIRVIQCIKDEGLAIRFADVNKRLENRQELMRIGKKAEVPMLAINNREGIYGADLIIKWLKENKENIDKV